MDKETSNLMSGVQTYQQKVYGSGTPDAPPAAAPAEPPPAAPAQPATETQPAATQTATPPQPTEPPATPPAEPVTEQPPAEGTPERADFDNLVQRAAKRMSLNLSDPGQRKTAESFAYSQAHIAKLQAELAAAKATPAAPPKEPELLTDWEKSLLAPATPPAAVQQPPAQVQQPPAVQQPPQQTTATPPADGGYRYNDVGDGWKSPEDWIKARSDAWASADPGQIQRVEAAIQVRFRDALVLPMVEQLLDKRLREMYPGLREILPVVMETAEQRHEAAAKEFAFGELKKTPGYEGIEELFKPLSENSITFDGEQWPDTPFNRVISANPELLDVAPGHENPETAERLRFLKVYKLAYRQYRAAGNGTSHVSGKTAQELVAAGTAMADRQRTESARQTLNAGGGATTLDAPTTDSYMRQMIKVSQGGRLSLSDLGRK